MSNQYRATSPAAIAAYGDGVLELDLSRWDEDDALRSGVLELVPRPYRVLVDNYNVDGVPVPMDAVIEAAFPVELEASLINGGVLARARRDAHATVDVEDGEAEATPPKRKKAAAPAEPKE